MQYGLPVTLSILALIATVEVASGIETTAPCTADADCPIGYVCETTVLGVCDSTARACVAGCRSFQRPCAAGQQCLQVECKTCPCPDLCQEPQCIQPPSNMTLWLPLDEPAGPTSLNAAGGNNGVQHGKPASTFGYVGNSLCFDGQQSYVEVPSFPAIDFTTGDFSIDAWIRRSSGDNGVRVIVDKRREGPGLGFPPVLGYSFFLFDGALSFQLADGGFTNYFSTATVPLDGAWHHVAVTVRRKDTAGGRFYLDGVPAGEPFNPLDHAGSLASGYPFRVGSRSSTVSAVFQGCIDEVETFSRALDPSEVAALYNAQSHGKCKVSCQLPPILSFCPDDGSLTANATLCSSLAAPASFAYDFQGLPVGAGCTGLGPSSFTPATGSVVVPPGGCATLPVKIALPEGTLPSPQVGCYELSVQGGAGSLATACRGTLRQAGGNAPPFLLTACILPPRDFIAEALLATELEFFLVRREGAAVTTSLPYRLSATMGDLSPTSAISLDGQPPGAAVQGTLVLSPGASTKLGVFAAFSDYQPGRFFNLLLEGDLAGTGQLQPLSSAVLRNVIPPTCSTPLIVQPPTGQTIAAGQPLTLSVMAASANPASYQWRRNGVDLADGGTLSGTVSSTLTIAAADFTDAGLYDVVVTNGCGVATSPPGAVNVAGAACTPGPTTLCLNGGRFAVGVDWQTPQGTQGSGLAVQLTSETGYFSFFDPANAELAVKVLNACSFSGSFWVFAAGLTDVEVAITVTDTQTGAVKHYHNPAGQAFLPIQDTSAFTTCLPASPSLASTARTPYAPPRSGKSAERQASAGSTSPATALVLGGRFRVEAHWQSATGTASDGQAVRLSGDSGTFWFFDSSNLELLVKVLDACNLNGHFWVFAGGLTDLQVELQVTDTLTGSVKSYTNPGGSPFLPIQDTSAFASCP